MMDRKEAATALQICAERLKRDKEFSNNEKIVEAIRFAVSILTASKGEYEYAAFVWDTLAQEYKQAGGSVMNELLCRKRFAEYVREELLPGSYDKSKVIFKRRLVLEHLGAWEVVKG